ncbi:hypothetical protein F5Y13DRAFT_183911 [Hypoxylon sp. FL1857]|nr:hypothetical protein F5Y13DRAFT_183911 [Hypoxylon sp. FL1857]
MSYWSEEGPALVTARVKTFFDNDPRFKWEGLLGEGANGIVYRLMYTNLGYSMRMAVKIAPIDVDLGGSKSYDEDDEEGPEEVESIYIERQWLQRLRGCAHVIQSLDIPRDPLFQTPAGVPPHRMLNWIFLEYAENGTVMTFVQRHIAQYPGELIPSRLLWRFFMCLLRAAIEMAYYDATRNDLPVDLYTAPLESLQSIPPGSLAHRDMGLSNTVIGAAVPWLQHPEHNISPILKLIDFGQAGEVDPAEDVFNRTGSQRNIMDIGEIMSYLISLTWGFLTNMPEAHGDFIARGIDPLLIDLVCQCLSRENDTRPGLIELAIRVHDQVLNRGPNAVERETDEAIIRRRPRKGDIDRDMI